MTALLGSRFDHRVKLALGVFLGAVVVFSGIAIAPGSAYTFAQEKASKPKRKDSRSPQRTEISFTTSVEPKQAKPGSVVTYTIHAEIEPDWHIYKYSATPADSGPKLTSFDFFDTAGLTIKGDWKPSEAPKKVKDEQFPDLDAVEFHETGVDWTIKLAVPKDAKAGKKVLRCQIGYMICKSGKGGICSIPGQWTLKDAELEVTAANGAAGGGDLAAKPAEPAEALSAAPQVDASNAKPASRSTDAPAAPAASAPAATTVIVAPNAVEQSISQGLLSFILLSITAGLSALVMPCVWPMVPITVNFFVKQGQARNGKTLSLALAYCGAIIVLFTSIGVLFSLVFGATSLQQLAIKWWFNLAIALMFIIFGLSLLGLFEIGLPNFLLNASAKQESRGGLIGVMFMAVTLAITSFTCTFPVVGALIVMASAGKFFYPVLGLAIFSTVLALPFFFLSLAPGLLSKLPKSGDWMNAVKVVGGLVEIGAALKFLNNVEIGLGVTPEDAWTGAYTVLTAWIVLSVVCGFYLLGLFRTDHDHDAVKVGPGRILTGTAFLALALFLTPALFGSPPQTQVWNRLIVGLLPPDVGRLKSATMIAASGDAESGERHATSSDPKLALVQERSFHGVSWGWSYEAAQEESKRTGKPIFIDFTGVYCANCRAMENGVMPRPEVVDRLKKFVTVQLWTDQVPIKTLTHDQQLDLAQPNAEFLQKFLKNLANPLYVMMTPEGEILGQLGGFIEPADYVAFIDGGLAKFAEKKKTSVAKADLPGTGAN